jgi:hypothetical protein
VPLAPSDVMNLIVDVNTSGLSVGVPKESIEDWNRYLVSLRQLEQPVPYDDLVWTTA